tara:strand:- start:4867 stop:5922 length:1056 start_codon:yes stop_codon:yes gene_type:complete
MATQTLANLANLLASNYGQLVVDSLVDSSGAHLKGLGTSIMPDLTITGRLRRNGRIFIGGAGSGDSGRYAAQWPVLHSVGTAASYSAGDAYPSATAAAYGNAALDWKRNWIAMEFDNLAAAAARGRSVVGGASIDAITREFEGKLKALFSAIETQLYGSGAGNDITGVKSFMNASATYAGISTTNGYWQPAVADKGAAAVTLDFMRELLRDMDDNNARPTEIWCSMLQWHKLQGLMDANIQYVDTNQGDLVVRSILFDGIPVYPIQSMSPAGVNDEIWFIDTDALELRFLPIAPSAGDVTVQTEASSFEGYPIGIDPVDSGTDSSSAVLKCYAQLVCLNPSKFGALVNLAV